MSTTQSESTAGFYNL